MDPPATQAPSVDTDTLPDVGQYGGAQLPIPLNGRTRATVKVTAHRNVPGLTGPRHVAAEVTKELPQTGGRQARRHVARRNMQGAVQHPLDPDPGCHASSHMGIAPNARTTHQTGGDVESYAATALPASSQGAVGEVQCCLLHRLWLQWLPLLQVCRDAGLCQRTLQLCCPRHLRNAVGAAVA